MPLISIVMPVYNVPAKYLEAAMDAVLHQTFADFELLVVDDASTAPHVAPFLKRFAANDARVKVFAQERNCGVSAARNLALEYAEGKYIGFLDADDLPDLDYFATLFAAAEENGADMVLCGFRRFHDDGRILKIRKPPARRALDGNPVVKKRMLEELSYALWNKLLLREVHGDLRFHTSLQLGEDVVYIAEAFLRTRSCVSLRYAGYAYRVNPKSATSMAQSGVESIRNTTTILPILAGLYRKYAPAEPFAAAFRRYILWLFLRYANKFGRVRDPLLALALWNPYRTLWAELAASLGCPKKSAVIRLTARLLAERTEPDGRAVLVFLRILLHCSRV